jgi:hypothetical protein
MRVVRTLALLAILAWSSVAIVATGAAAAGALASLLRHPTWSSLALAVAAMVPAYAWLCFVALSLGWIIQRRFSKIWVFTGSAAGLVSLAFVAVPVPHAVLYAVPSVLFAAWICWFHLERTESAA